MRSFRLILATGLSVLLTACGAAPAPTAQGSGLVASFQLAHPLLHPGNEQVATVELAGGAGGLAHVEATIAYADGSTQRVDDSAESGTVTLRWQVPAGAALGAAQVQVAAQDVCGCSDRPRAGAGRQQFRVAP